MKLRVPSPTSIATLTTPDTTRQSLLPGRSRRFGIRWLHPEPRVSILEDNALLGRDAGCDITLPGEEVSRTHARVQIFARGVQLQDQQSRNGLFVEGQRVTAQPLNLGDVVRMGEWVGVAGSIREDERAAPKFEELYTGWYGGALLDERMQSARRVAMTNWPVVIQGETGTGKEGAARAIHAWSGRSGPFMAVDCGALPSELAESQLFGHRKGAFTGAEQAAPGYFRAAQGGTVFLDEILNLSLSLQAKLLRVLADNKVVPVGETTPIPVDVRVISAAHTPLSKAVDAGAFRSDLMARLESCVVELPVLRERREDIYPLFCKLFQLHSGTALRCDAKFVEALLLYNWPRHVRELSQETKQLLVQHGNVDRVWTKSMLPSRIRQPLTPLAPPQSQSNHPEAAHARGAHAHDEATDTPKRKKYDERDFEACRKALQDHANNVRQAAKALGWEPGRVYRVMDAYEKALRRGSGQ